MKKAGSSPKGLFSSKDNPMGAAKSVSTRTGPSRNPDCMKADKLLKQAQKKEDSLRGTSGRM